MIVAAKSGYRPDSVAVALRAGSVNTITLMLIAQAVSVEAMIVTERVVSDESRIRRGRSRRGRVNVVLVRRGPWHAATAPTIA